MSEAGVDRHAGSIFGWLMVWTLVLYGISQELGFKYAQRVPWPTDIMAFQYGGFKDLDVVVLGSSKASFGISPQVLDNCLEKSIGRETNSVNLGRMYGTAFTDLSLYQDLLVGERVPKVLLVAVEPESLNAHNHNHEKNLPFHADLGDLPDVVSAVRHWEDVVGIGRLLTRGVEALSLYAADAYGTDQRLRWMMLSFGGGQWCETEECRLPQSLYWQHSSRRWDDRVKDELPTIKAERFTDYVIAGGLEARAFEALLDRAKYDGVTVVILKLPLHDVFREQVPRATSLLYDRYLAKLANARELTLLDASDPELESNREMWLDPDHLNPRGAGALMKVVCPAVAKVLKPDTTEVPAEEDF